LGVSGGGLGGWGVGLAREGRAGRGGVAVYLRGRPQ